MHKPTNGKAIEKVLVPIEEYKYLKERDYWLSCLEEAGVDNWSGMELAIDIREGVDE